MKSKLHFNTFREKIAKLIAVETARAAITTTQWTKKVIIEKMTNASENVSEPLVNKLLIPLNYQLLHWFSVDASCEDREAKNPSKQQRR